MYNELTAIEGLLKIVGRIRKVLKDSECDECKVSKIWKGLEVNVVNE